MRSLQRTILMLTILGCLGCLGCRSSEYYHRSNSGAQRQADYAECSGRADARRTAEMPIAEYTAIIRECMQARGYEYTD